MNRDVEANDGDVAAGPWRVRVTRRNFLAAGGATLFLVACGDDDSATADPDSDQTTEGANDTQPSASVDTLTIAAENVGDQEPDPHLARNSGGNWPIVLGVGENLVRRDLTNNLVPALAESWETSDDGLAWSFTLREGVKMHDGSTLTANDVKTAIDRIQSEDFGEDFTAGFGTINSQLDSVTVDDPLHVTIRTKAPYATMLDDMPVPIPTDYYNEVGEEGFRSEPMAAGPFKFVSQRINTSMTFERFEEFWDSDRLANFETLVLTLIAEESARIAAVQSGAIDAAHALSPLAVEQLESSPDVRVLRQVGVGLTTLYFNDLNFPDRDTPYHDLRVRQALSFAIDREAIAESLYRGFATPTANFFPTTTLGFDESLEPDPFDPDRARQLLEEAGHPDLRLELTSKTTDAVVIEIQQLAQLLQSFWEDVGISVTYTAVDPAVSSAHNRALDWPTGPQLAAFPANLAIDPGTASQIVFLSDGSSPRVNDPRLDELVRTLQTVVDPDQREEVALQITNHVADNLFIVPLFKMDGAVAIGPNVAEWDQQESFPYAGPWWYLRAN